MDFIEAIQFCIRHHISYEEWPVELKISGISDELMGPIDPEKYNAMRETGYFLKDR